MFVFTLFYNKKFGIYVNVQEFEKLYYSWMIKLSAAVKIENIEEYLMMQGSAHTAVLSEEKDMLNIDYAM